MTKVPNRQQTSFSEICSEPGWMAPIRPRPPSQAWALPQAVTEELGEFFKSLQKQGLLCPGSVANYVGSLTTTARVAQRFLGRELVSLSEMYTVPVIAAVVKDDRFLDREEDHYSPGWMARRRRALNRYAVRIGVRGLDTEQAKAILKQGYRAAATRRGETYSIGHAKPAAVPRILDPEDVRRVEAVAATGKSFWGNRNRILIRLTKRTGFRVMQILGMEGTDFKLRHGQLYVAVKQKGRTGKLTKEVDPDLIPELLRYVDSFNNRSLTEGWNITIGFGIPGPFWRGSKGKPWTGPGVDTMLLAKARAAGVKPFRMHALRHLRAAIVGQHLDIADAALEGRWDPRVYARYYAKPLRPVQPRLPAAEPPEGS